jgi:Zn ribbon nucleic-acid-binding protein
MSTSSTSSAIEARAARKAEIIAQPCPQCTFEHSICEVRWFEEEELRFLTCPRCGYAEETWRDQGKQWKGHGVYVVHGDEGLVKAGTFDHEITDEEAPLVVAEFLRFRADSVFVTRWNEAAGRVDVLLGPDTQAGPDDPLAGLDSRATSIVF